MVRLGFTGVGGRGAHLLELCLSMDDVAVPAVCDRQRRHRERAAEDVAEAGRPAPDTHADHADLIERGDLDAVVIATPWRHHVPMAVDAMAAGLDVGLEVGPANSVEECHELVATAERTGRRCMLLENCCYRRDCMAVLGMVRDGVFGELVHCEGGYCHDLRERIVTGGSEDVDRGDGLDFRAQQNRHRNGDIYPTHGVGPMAKLLDVNAGNRFTALTATASKSRGLADWADRNLEADHPSRAVEWAVGDVVTTTIECANGETLTVTHDVSLPRPYSNKYHVQGTRGVWRRDFEVVHLEDESPDHEWEDFAPYREQYDHPMWRAYEEAGVKAGHGGIDYLVLRDFVKAMRGTGRPPIDVYDAAAWMAIAPLSEQSIATGERVAFPDFTGGAWMDREAVFGHSETL